VLIKWKNVDVVMKYIPTIEPTITGINMLQARNKNLSQSNVSVSIPVTYTIFYVLFCDVVDVCRKIILNWIAEK
jgi:hypothetical protein